MRVSLKQNNYICKVFNFKGECIHDKEYITLPEIATDLNVSKDVIYNISSRKGNYNTMYKKFIFQPVIEITRINPPLQKT